MALKLKGSTSGFVGLDAPSVAGNNTLILPTSAGECTSDFSEWYYCSVTTFTQVTISRNGDLTVPGTISIGGTLTYEDVTSVDSVGIVTARGLSIFGNTTGLQQLLVFQHSKQLQQPQLIVSMLVVQTLLL